MRFKIVISKGGFTLIELIIFIVVGAIILPASFVAFTSAMRNISTPDHYVKARFFAEQKIEELTKDAFGTFTPPVDQLYSTVPGQIGYQWKWSICSTGSTEIDLQCSDTHNTVVFDYSYYQRIEVTVLTPEGLAYDVNTLISKRPKSL